MPAPAARRSIPNGAPCALSQTPVHNSSTDRSSASLLLRSRMHLGSHNTKKAFQNSVHKTYSGDLLDRHSAYFTEKKQCFSPRILKTSHQSFLMKYRYYNPPSRKRSSSPSRPPFKSSDISNEKKSELHRFLEDSHVRPHSVHFSQQPVEVGVLSVLQSKKSEAYCSYTKVSWLRGNEMDNGFIGFAEYM
ncbi:spermatogenesis-associated protein 7 homolog [Pipra filicauda]|uniref:Spermatogenesis-associated protein 7 homolog n=1 Tax=Pipra filicauda TaxID=649802 RepID=A0A6J2GWC4_9PASS|nr:spermatogenesis-associated protein 7 homolog [Pipra filicauda]